MEKCRAKPPAAAVFLQLPRRDRSEAVDALHMIFDAAIRIVFQVMAQPAYRAIDEDFLMRVRAAPRRSIASKHANVVIRVPASTPPPALQIANQPRHRVTRIPATIACQCTNDLIA